MLVMTRIGNFLTGNRTATWLLGGASFTALLAITRRNSAGPRDHSIPDTAVNADIPPSSTFSCAPVTTDASQWKKVSDIIAWGSERSDCIASYQSGARTQLDVAEAAFDRLLADIGAVMSLPGAAIATPAIAQTSKRVPELPDIAA